MKVLTTGTVNEVGLYKKDGKCLNAGSSPTNRTTVALGSVFVIIFMLGSRSLSIDPLDKRCITRHMGTTAAGTCSDDPKPRGRSF